jgi:hypothetical protein
MKEWVGNLHRHGDEGARQSIQFSKNQRSHAVLIPKLDTLALSLLIDSSHNLVKTIDMTISFFDSVS